ncbi:Protein kinase-like domain protein [Fusarium austroafricanum]|uniref:Protein kinase-like domain protein n=1 Tax=Fusarium austroafricanum TaxID=2364996 RepID=A0A8H4KRF9_9HYPO|nr:Protein kinase-like domain protein [Fusarium austroafricanum]
MDVSQYSAGPGAYDNLSAYQITVLFNKHGLTKSDADQFAAKLLGKPVSPTPVQGGSSYTVFSDSSNQVVQFRDLQLPEQLLDLAGQLYGDFVPACRFEGMFGSVYVYVENNFHIDENTGRITGVVDWANAKIAPFGVSLASMEVVLGIQTRAAWHFHHNHQALRKLFWDAFYDVTGNISDDDRHSMDIARLFGLFWTHGYEEKEYAISYLSTLCQVDTDS